MNDIFNYLQLNENLSSSGMPTAEQMKEVAQAGVKVVIDLALKTSPKVLADEDQIVESLGMKYIHIPVEWDNPTRKNLDDFFNQDFWRIASCHLAHKITRFNFKRRLSS